MRNEMRIIYISGRNNLNNAFTKRNKEWKKVFTIKIINGEQT